MVNLQLENVKVVEAGRGSTLVLTFRELMILQLTLRELEKSRTGSGSGGRQGCESESLD